jgi:hypothetical protein
MATEDAPRFEDDTVRVRDETATTTTTSEDTVDDSLSDSGE